MNIYTTPFANAWENALEFLENAGWKGDAVRVGLIVGIHVAGLASLLYFQTARPDVTEIHTITASIIAPPSPEVVPPTPEPPKPEVKKVEEPKKIIAAPTPVPDPKFTAPPPDPAPTPPAPSAPPAPPSLDTTPPDPNYSANYANNPIVYPPRSRRLGEQGKVLLHVWVSISGAPEKIEIQQSSGFPQLDTAAMEAVKRWKFVPAKQGLLPVAAWVSVPIVFSLTQ